MPSIDYSLSRLSFSHRLRIQLVDHSRNRTRFLDYSNQMHCTMCKETSGAGRWIVLWMGSNCVHMQHHLSVLDLYNRANQTARLRNATAATAMNALNVISISKEESEMSVTNTRISTHAVKLKSALVTMKTQMALQSNFLFVFHSVVML